MPRGEISHRVRESFLSRQRFEAPTAELAPKWFPIADPRNNLSRLVQDIWSGTVQSCCVTQAQQALDSHIVVMGHTWSTVDREWNRDPATGFEWSDARSYKIDYRHLFHNADPKWTWEVNRLLFLLPVAFGNIAGVVDSVDAEQFIDSILMDWTTKTRMGRGPAWAASIEVAIRAIAITFAVQSISSPSASLLEECARSINEHIAWIKRFPSKFSSANNHRTAEISALLVLNSNWTGVLNDREVASLEAELVAVADSLFASDGIGLEQSPTYSRFSLEFLATVLLFHSWSSARNRSHLQRMTEKGAECLIQFSNEDGSLFRYGDDDEGKLVTVAVPQTEYATSISLLIGKRTVTRNTGLLILRRRRVLHSKI